MPSQIAHQQQLEALGDREYYDPDQSMEERRGIRKEIRDLSRELNGTSHTVLWTEKGKISLTAFRFAF